MTGRMALGIASATLILAGCGGGGIEGAYYPPTSNAFLDHMVFGSDGKVVLTRWGQSQEARFEVKGREVTIVHEGSVSSFVLTDQGCLEAPLMGSFCKRSGGDATTAPEAGESPAGTWRASFGGDAIVLMFQPNNKVKVELSENGTTSHSSEGDWKLTAAGVTLQVPDGPPIELTRKGETLEGSMSGTTLVFTRQPR
jgi:hypothetical protein